MATLYITEYAGTGFVVSNYGPFKVQAQAPQEPPITTQIVSISGSATQSAAFSNTVSQNNKQTYLIRVHCDSICSILIGANPTASVSSPRLVAGQTEYFSVIPGHAISVIANV
jgi:hypothetical protein